MDHRPGDADGESVRTHRAGFAPFDFRFVWAAHALMNWTGVDVELDLGEGAPYRLSHDAEGKESGETFAWPRLGAIDFGKPDALPAKQGWKLFTAEPGGIWSVPIGSASQRYIVYEYTRNANPRPPRRVPAPSRSRRRR